MQRRISEPVIGLTRTVNAVRRARPSTTSPPFESDDEIGELVEGFNAMLGEIRERDGRISAHLEGLEQQVADRTAELNVAKDAASPPTPPRASSWPP
jgi:two-component system sensor histidine kinase BarA